MSRSNLRLVQAAPSPLDGALMMADHGFAVLRLKPGSKVPAIGPKEATTDRTTIRDWYLFGDVPNCNFAYLLGPDHVGIDFDLYKAGGREARAAFGEIPPTLQVFTPGGGEHYVLEIARQIGQQKPAPTIDVRTGNGYLVCPGSIVDGKPYVVGNNAPPARCPPHIDAQLGKRLEPYDRDAAWEGGTCGDWRNKIDAALWDRIRTEGPDRSKHSFMVMSDLFAIGLTDDDVVLVMDEPGAMFAAKFAERGDLEREVSDVRREWRASHPLAPFSEIKPPPAAIQPSDLLEFPSDISLAELLTQEANALVHGILHRGEQGCIYGVPGAGKSFVAVDLGYHIALEKDWHGRKVKRAPVLYVCLEGVRGFRKRMYVAKERLGDPGAYFSRLTAHISLMREAAGDAGHKTIVEAAKVLAAKCGEPVGMIVIDTLARAVSGNDENAVADMMAYIEGRAGAIARETGAAVLTVHHPNAEGRLRGSTSLPAAFETILRIDVEKDRRTLVGQKIKDDEDGPLFDFELEKVHLGFNEDGLPASSCIVRKAARVATKEDKPSKFEMVFRECFEALREAGKLIECKTSDGGDMGLRADIAVMRDRFCKSYGTKHPDREWRRSVGNKQVPYGFELLTIDGAEYIWRPL